VDFQQVPLLARLSAEAPGLELIAGVVLLPMLQPVVVAEQYSALDHITGGRLIFGVGLGYRQVEFDALGVPRSERVPRMAEYLEVIRRLWSGEEVHYIGRYVRLEGARLMTLPLQRPSPPIWMAADSDRGVQRAAQLGDAWYLNPHTTLKTLERQMGLYREALSALGRPLPPEIPIRREIFIGENREAAMRECLPYVQRKYQTYKQWGHHEVLPQDDTWDLAPRELLEDRVIIGGPQECAEQIDRYRARLGANHFVFSVQWPGLSHARALEMIHLLGEEVFPFFRASA
jgi:alkanesulfonate monooxygenase SsuD/methylene tetrahydromethanopterin reductase-like flavin-dependent oxidoreductase (luciferase family)